MLAPAASTMLRAGVARPCAGGVVSGSSSSTATKATGLSFLRTAATCPYSTMTAPLSLARRVSSPCATTSLLRSQTAAAAAAEAARPSLSMETASAAVAATPRIRPYSSSTSSSTQQQQQRPLSDHDLDARAAARAAEQAAKQHQDEPPLDWNTFFRLRRTRRRWQLAFSVATLLGGAAAGGYLASSGAADPLVNQVPLDPLVTLGLITFACAALGWLAGPSVGSAVFYALNRRFKAQMLVKEGQFFARIKKNRVDPSASSAGNPVPDFYGEKISSVAGYRQWLKDQRAFNKKRTTFV